MQGVGIGVGLLGDDHHPLRFGWLQVRGRQHHPLEAIGKAHGGGRLLAPQGRHQLVVAPAATQLQATGVVDFEHHAGVVVQPSSQPKVEGDAVTIDPMQRQ